MGPCGWALLVHAAFVLPLPFRGVSGDPLAFTGPTADVAGVFWAGSPSQETAASLLPQSRLRPRGNLTAGSQS